MSVIATYALSAFPNQRIRARKLTADILATPSITNVLEGIVSDNAECRLAFSAALTGAEQTALDAVVAAHQGVDVTVKFHAGSTLVISEIVVIGGWQVLGRCRADPSFFVGDLTNAFGRLVGEIQTTGVGAQLRVIERNAGTEVDLMPTPFAVPDTSVDWSPCRFSTQVAPRAGESTYRLEGRLNGATLFSARSFAMSLLELISL